MCEEKRIDFFVSFLTLIVLYSSSVDIWDLRGVDGGSVKYVGKEKQ